MRPGQNKRMRGRNNRRGPNPLTRTYGSNGPDVKVRGTAQHVGEKYLQLARDAQSSGDPVMAESYLQHAEHYFRLIAAAQQSMQQQLGFNRPGSDNGDNDDMDDDDDGGIPDRFSSPFDRQQQQVSGHQPQPVLAPPAAGFDEQPGAPAPAGNDRPHQERSHQERPHQERPQRQDRNNFRDHRDQQQARHRGPRDDRPPRQDHEPRIKPTFVPAVAPDPSEMEQPATGLPAFITGGRTNPVLPPVSEGAEPREATPRAEAGDGQFPLRNNRRRRRPRVDGDEVGATQSLAEDTAGSE